MIVATKNDFSDKTGFLAVNGGNDMFLLTEGRITPFWFSVDVDVDYEKEPNEKWRGGLNNFGNNELKLAQILYKEVT